MKTSAMAVKVRADPPLERLRAHLLTHLDMEYVDGFIPAFLELCDEIRTRVQKNGHRKCTQWDGEIERLQNQIDEHHTSGKPIAGGEAGYWDIFYKSVDLCSRRAHYLRGHWGRPRDEVGDCLIEWLNDHYPPEIARKSRGGNFETTLRLMYEIADWRIVADLTDKIFRALNNSPPLLAEQIKKAWKTR